MSVEVWLKAAMSQFHENSNTGTRTRRNRMPSVKYITGGILKFRLYGNDGR
ncbi:MAG TPA: hypothetical protein V6C81_28920 [Planktothrix sp.]|jgi:hypothetical protein